MLLPSPEDEALARDLVAEATAELDRLVPLRVREAIRQSLLDDLLLTEAGLRKLRRLRAADVNQSGEVDRLLGDEEPTKKEGAG